MRTVPLPREVPRRHDPVCLEARVRDNRPVGDRYWLLSVEAYELARAVRPGQFSMLTPARHVAGAPTLPRPMAIYDRDTETGAVQVLYGVVGEGTRELTRFGRGDVITVVGPLGRPFDVGGHHHCLLVLGRGIGTCSLTLLAREEVRRGGRVVAVTSGRNEKAVVGAELYASLGVETYRVTDSAGSSDPDALRARLQARFDPAPPGRIAVCGSERLARLAAQLGQRWDIDVQVSVEAHMACGLGYCHGCAAADHAEGTESPLVCVEGPVFGIARERRPAAGIPRPHDLVLDSS